MGRLTVLCALLALAGAVCAQDAETLARIRATLDVQPRLRAEFEQVKRMSEAERPQVARGRMLVWGGAGVLWEMDHPVRMAIVLRDDTTIHVDAEGRRRVRRARDDPAAARIGRVLRALLHGDTAALEQWFEIAARMERQAWSIVLTPRRGPMSTFLRSMEVTGGARVERVQINEMNGDTTRIQFSNYREALPLSEDERGLLGLP